MIVVVAGAAGYLGAPTAREPRNALLAPIEA
jgi:hypothetical protein